MITKGVWIRWVQMLVKPINVEPIDQGKMDGNR